MEFNCRILNPTPHTIQKETKKKKKKKKKKREGKKERHT